MPPTLPLPGSPPDRAQDPAPFVVEHHQEELTPSGTFRPVSRLTLTPALRTGGLWAAVPPEDFHTLILLLTFLTPNGWCRPTLPELAAAMRVSQEKARTRMGRLVQREWQGQPLVMELPRPDGLAAFVPGRHLVAHEEIAPSEPPAPALPAPAGREAVIAASRARYAKPREEVEQEIAERMGWAPPSFDGDDPAIAERKRQAFRQMTNLGVPKAQALDLLARHDLDEIERQLTWLAHRAAKQPTRYLVAAIEGHYDMPASLRARLVTAAEGVTELQRGALAPEPAPTEPAPHDPATDPAPIGSDGDSTDWDSTDGTFPGTDDHLPLP